MTRLASNVLGGLYDSVFRPENLVEARSVRLGSVREQMSQLRHLFAVYLLNLVLYAGPLTVAGFGRDAVPPVPAWFATAVPVLDPAITWNLGYAFLQNSLFLLAATTLTLVTFHVGLVVTMQSSGFLQSAYAVVYSTSIYLVAIFTAVWYLSMNPDLAAARVLVVDAQKTFVYAVIDWLGAPLGLPGGRPAALDVAAVSAAGQAVLSLLLVLVVYFLYSLYLGTRINHGADRLTALLTVAGVACSPAVYVAASVIVTTG